MLRNLSYNDPKINREVNQAVGKAYSFIASWRMGGTGSQKFIITEASDEIWQLLERENSTNYANIELRPKGVIVRFKSFTESFGLIIPFREMELEVSKTELHICRKANFIKMKTLKDEEVDLKFLKQIKDISGLESLSMLDK